MQMYQSNSEIEKWVYRGKVGCDHALNVGFNRATHLLRCFEFEFRLSSVVHPGIAGHAPALNSVYPQSFIQGLPALSGLNQEKMYVCTARKFIVCTLVFEVFCYNNNNIEKLHFLKCEICNLMLISKRRKHNSSSIEITLFLWR